MINTDQDGMEFSLQEEAARLRMLAQKKEKKIKTIRILTVIAYLMTVSTVAMLLSAYYIFIWNPHAGNSTQTLNTEGVIMALQRASSEYVFENSADHKNKTAGSGRVIYNVLDSHETISKSLDRSNKVQMSTIQPTTFHTVTTFNNISEPIIVNKN